MPAVDRSIISQLATVRLSHLYADYNSIIYFIYQQLLELNHKFTCSAINLKNR